MGTYHNQKHKLDLSVLKVIDKLLSENEIEYFGAYGTLIGAYRHQGFIPWDDDVDILIPFKYKYQVEKIFNDYCKNNDEYFFRNTRGIGYQLLEPSYFGVSNTLRYASRNVQRVNVISFGSKIDIYYFTPLSNELKNEIEKTEKQFNYLSSAKVMRPKTLPKKSAARLIRLMDKRFKNKLNILEKKIFEYSKLDEENIQYSWAFFEAKLQFDKFDKRDVYPIIRKKFEDMNLCVPRNSHKILNDYYGKWEKIPEVDWLYHGIDTYDLNPLSVEPQLIVNDLPSIIEYYVEPDFLNFIFSGDVVIKDSNIDLTFYKFDDKTRIFSKEIKNEITIVVKSLSANTKRSYYYDDKKYTIKIKGEVIKIKVK